MIIIARLRLWHFIWFENLGRHAWSILSSQICGERNAKLWILKFKQFLGISTLWGGLFCRSRTFGHSLELTTITGSIYFWDRAVKGVPRWETQGTVLGSWCCLGIWPRTLPHEIFCPSSMFSRQLEYKLWHNIPLLYLRVRLSYKRLAPYPGSTTEESRQTRQAELKPEKIHS